MTIKPFYIDDLYNNRLNYCHPKKIKNIKLFMDVFPPFIQAISEGKKYNNIDLKNEEYFKYLSLKINKNRLSDKGKKHVLRKMRDAINLFNSIKNEGIKNYLEMHLYNNRLCLFKGGRRVVIAKILNIKTVLVKIHD